MLLALLPLASESSTMKIHSKDNPWWSRNCFRHDGFWVSCATQTHNIKYWKEITKDSNINKAFIAQVVLVWVWGRWVSAPWFPLGPSVCRETPPASHHTGLLHSPVMPPAPHRPEEGQSDVINENNTSFLGRRFTPMHIIQGQCQNPAKLENANSRWLSYCGDSHYKRPCIKPMTRHTFKCDWKNWPWWERSFGCGPSSSSLQLPAH